MSYPPTPTASSSQGGSQSTNGSGLLRTPQTAERVDGTVVFLREEGQSDFVPLHRPRSVTLQELVDEFNISSVVECDARGVVQPRAVAFDSPSDVLHSGRHYVVRRDARAEDRGSRVTFRGKIQVKEYELEHATPPAQYRGGEQTDAQRPLSFLSAIGTPLPMGGHRAEAELDDENSLSHTLVSGQKRPREDADETAPSEATAQSTAAEVPTVTTTADSVAPRSLFFSDRTNTIAAPANTKVELTSHGSWSSVSPSATHTADNTGNDDATRLANKENSGSALGSAEGPRAAPLRFIPFPLEIDGTETLITLEDLKAICATEETEQHKQRHEEALSILDGARRVLFRSP